jgi:hypothetical protein
MIIKVKKKDGTFILQETSRRTTSNAIANVPNSLKSHDSNCRRTISDAVA